MNTKSLRLISLPSFALILSACGGGSSSSTQQPSITTPSFAVSAQPRELEEVNWQSARLIQAENPMQNTVEVVGSTLNINVKSADIATGAHLQIYINSDNKAETGFQFDNQAWEESGVDFLIEDGDLFKSTANNTGWNWNVNIGAIDYAIDTDSASAKIDLSLLGDICNNLKIGIMTRDEFWDIETFSPASSQMQTFNVAYCNTQVADTVKPEINLIGANPVNLTVGETFNDTGATASDNIDGDITSNIHLKSDIDTTSAGTYLVTYLVSDLAGNSTSITRSVIVSDVAVTEGIVVDGNTNDWGDIPTLASTSDATMKVTDDEDKLYILITSSNLGFNTQLLMDTDNNASTGLDLSAQVNAWLGGADYMIENNSLDKSKCSCSWTWDYGIAPIEYIKTGGILEIAIKKSDFNNLANKVPMGYVSRTEEWNANYTLPKQDLPVYTLKFPTVANPVTANNDSVTTLNSNPITIDVLANDNSSNNGALTVSILNQPESGTASVVQNKIRYQPNANFTGTVNFNYQVKDNAGNTDTASVKIIVTAAVTNVAPIANNDTATTSFDTSVTIRPLNNDTDADGDSLSISSVTNPSNGTAVISGNTIRYTPDTGYSGNDSFNYTISDGNNETDSARVTVTVNGQVIPDPVAANDSASTLQNQSTTINVLSNDSANAVLSGVSNPSSGSAVIANNRITYTPSNNFTGTDTFTYTVSNGNGATDTATVTVTVNNLPNAAPIARNDSATTNGIRTRSINVLNNDSDADGDTLTISSFTQPNNGSVSNSNGILRYTPNALFSGSESFTYTISDGQGGTDTATVTVTVPANNAPDAVEDSAVVFNNETINVDVLSNDTDPDGDVLSVLPGSVNAITAGISASLNPNGTILVDPQGTVASLSVAYTVTDGRGGTDIAVLTLASTDPNDPNISFPTVNNEFVTTPINTPIFIDVLANDFDSDGDTLSIDMVDDPANGTTEKVTQNGVAGILYTPDPGFEGVDVFFYGVPDGRGNNGSGFVEVTVGNP